MSEVVKIQKTIYGLQGINSVIDTSFTQLVPPTQVVPTSSFTTVKETLAFLLLLELCLRVVR